MGDVSPPRVRTTRAGRQADDSVVQAVAARAFPIVGCWLGDPICRTSVLEIANTEDLRPGDRVGLFSYGSGCGAEFYSGLIGPMAREAVRAAGLSALLDERHPVSVDAYEEVERERTGYIDCGDYEPGPGGLDDWYDRHYRGKGYLVFGGMRDYYRRYAWS